MELSSEDSLRLNVLLRQDLKAIRIDDSRMIVYALTDKGEAQVPLNPNCREEKYLLLVRELFSTHVLGSPGGYPVYLKRWTRMGQERDEQSMARLLLLGEPEAVVAVVHTPGISLELAKRAWWSYPSADMGRQLLQSTQVVEARLGAELADYLIEFLPFEEQHQAMIDSVRLILQPGLIDAEKRASLWKKAKRKQSYYIGFLSGAAGDLPINPPAHPLHSSFKNHFSEILHQENRYTDLLLKTMDSQGQAFLNTTAQVLQKIPNQDATVELMNAVGAYFSNVRPDDKQYREIEHIMHTADDTMASSTGIKSIMALHPELAPQLHAILSLSMLSEYLVAPIFGQSNAIGTVMRRNLKPVTTPILKQLATLSPNITT
ncbi:MAG: sulfur reduction protein DsrS [Thiothrix sp.]|nr:MAG: sulfur reduction protein DsrS [Thiothrix sp.]